MAELKADTLCKYCLGCNKLSNYNFIGTRNCKGFIPEINFQKQTQI
jgi:hypothetical protein